MSPFAPRVAAVSFAALLSLATAGCNAGGFPEGDAVASAEQALASTPSLGSAASFAVLANQAVTCTGGSVVGNVGTNQSLPTGSITQTNCPILGAIDVGTQASKAAYADFLNTYAAVATLRCDRYLTGTLANVRLTPGVYCFATAAALTGTLTLDGPSTATWVFKIGDSGPGALTGTNFSMVMANGANPCNVTWWVNGGATLTDSNFFGTILASASDTVTRGSFRGRTFAQADVTLTGVALLGCTSGTIGGGGHGGSGGSGGHGHAHCNQGIGNGSEGCDPGNSNHHNESNDEGTHNRGH